MSGIGVRMSCLQVGAALSACGNIEGANLVFRQQQVVGVSISASPTEQSGELTLGYKDKNIAVVPVAVRQADGSLTKVVSVASENGQPFEDSMSVLGQFDVQAGAQAGPSVGLGKFFATGLAARVLAEGFADKLAGGGE